MPATSAALCLWRMTPGGPEFLAVHPGGPYWANKDDGAWSLPKGEYDPDNEAGLDAARREFHEELGHPAPSGPTLELGDTRLKSGKIINAWAVEGDLDVSTVTSNLFEMEWPPRSGRQQQFPEVDRAQWCNHETAAAKLNPAQVVLIDRLIVLIATNQEATKGASG